MGSFRISLRASRQGWNTPAPARSSKRARTCRIHPVTRGGPEESRGAEGRGRG